LCSRSGEKREDQSLGPLKFPSWRLSSSPFSFHLAFPTEIGSGLSPFFLKSTSLVPLNIRRLDYISSSPRKFFPLLFFLRDEHFFFPTIADQMISPFSSPMSSVPQSHLRMDKDRTIPTLTLSPNFPLPSRKHTNSSPRSLSPLVKEERSFPCPLPALRFFCPVPSRNLATSCGSFPLDD